MKCPVDDTQLAISERQGVEIDYCPECRGVWLDRGELDKLIERSTQFQPTERQSPLRPSYDEGRHESKHEQHYDEHYQSKKKKSSFLGDIFDF